MKISYYPGCTLKTTAKNFEDSAIAALMRLGVELAELPRWNCCGTVYSLASDDLIHKLAPIRNLIRVKEQKQSRVLTLCAMCYNTLKRANIFIREDSESRDKMNDFMYREEIDYKGDVEVLHLLEFLRDEIKFDQIAKKVKHKFNGLKVAPYYGCLLLRPKEAAIDNPENPTVLENLLNSIGIEPVDFPYRNECCGAYQTVNEPDLVADRIYKIVNYAKGLGADMIATSCPLCQFNLDRRQELVQRRFADFEEMPVVYFTQLMGMALGVDKKTLGFNSHYIKPTPLCK